MADSGWIEKISYQIHAKNPEYSLSEIKSMVMTSTWELGEGASHKGIYLRTISRILEEKGYEYTKNGFQKACVSTSAITEVQSPYYDMINNASRAKELASILVNNSHLTDNQMFVLACVYKIEPHFADDKYQKILEGIAPHLDSRKLSNKEIGELLGVASSKVTSIKQKALKKLADQYETK